MSENRVRLGGAVALITGGTRGLGLSLARQLADKGCHLALLDHDEHELRLAEQVLAPRTRVLTLACDPSDSAAVDEAVALALAELGRIDLVIDFRGGRTPRLPRARTYDLSAVVESRSLERTARRIVRAIVDGEADVPLSWRARLARFAHGLAPALGLPVTSRA